MNQETLFEIKPTASGSIKTAISLWQPWATLWALGEKQAETRHWNFPCRYLNRTIYIHAAQKWNSELAEYCQLPGFREAFIRHLDIVGEDVLDHPGVAYRMVSIGNGRYIKLPFGAVIGSVKVVADKPTEQALLWFPEQHREDEAAFGDYSENRRAWIGVDHKVLESYVPYKGAQGFFTLAL